MTYPNITKGRYNDYKEALHHINGFDDKQVESILTTMQLIFKFEPNFKTYKPEDGVKRREYRKQRQQETGLSTYQISNQAKYYQEHKDVLNAKRVENHRKIRMSMASP
jgi:hypothetical protein